MATVRRNRNAPPKNLLAEWEAEEMARIDALEAAGHPRDFTAWTNPGYEAGQGGWMSTPPEPGFGRLIGPEGIFTPRHTAAR